MRTRNINFYTSGHFYVVSGTWRHEERNEHNDCTSLSSLSEVRVGVKFW